ncbi:MAG TPA: NTP transferase domain-containing protein [Gemmatimonadales bacterium]|nr:NTP transferase domain-containing protein [Gemmatimonadales bacterium]
MNPPAEAPPADPTLLVLAAGLSSRYGSPKQLAGVGPGGETLLEYAVFDALRAGFDRVVIIAQPAFRPALEQRLERAPCPVTVCEQPADALPPGRRKPWGTAHAVLAAEAHLPNPFAVINSDDFYGQNAYQLLGGFLRTDPGEPAPVFALVGYRLRDTLSDVGGVGRAVCRHLNRRLTTIAEVTEVRETESGIRGRGENGEALHLTGEETISMNAWGFTPALFPLLRRRFDAFRGEHQQDTDAEFRLSTEVNGLVRAGEAAVEILPTSGTWTGMTHAGDHARVQAYMAEQVAAGRYPPSLF